MPHMYNDRDSLVQAIKALADENRVKLLTLLNSRECNVSEMAALMDLTEPTVSHHLARLREAGLVNLRASGNQRFYRLNRGMLPLLGQRLAELESAPFEAVNENDQSWIEALNFEEADRKVLSDYTVNRRLKHIPVQQKKLMVVLRWLATEFQPDVKYTEREVNAILVQHHEDFARLRRELIDFGFLRRERGGGQYWLTPADEA